MANKKECSTGKCAKHVREALVAGGLDTSENPISAKDYGPFLTNKQFKPVPDNDVETGAFSKADVVVIQPYEGGSSHGHIAMYSGTAGFQILSSRICGVAPATEKPSQSTRYIATVQTPPH